MQVTHWHNELDKATTAFKAAFQSLAGEELNWKPNTATWSIAQNIDHLIEVNESYFPIINKVRSNSLKVSFIWKIDFLVNAMGNIILNSSKAEVKRKVSTFAVWEPAKSEISDTIFHDFEASQQRMKQLITDSKDLLEKGQVICSPANPNICYKLEKAFDIIAAHQWRHYNQAIEVRNVKTNQ